LFRRDGQTLTELEQRLPMTRFGVMKHLKVLEQAGLITTRRRGRGREKLHFLNPVPISGSSQDGSTNAAVLPTATALAPAT